MVLYCIQMHTIYQHWPTANKHICRYALSDTLYIDYIEMLVIVLL